MEAAAVAASAAVEAARDAALTASAAAAAAAKDAAEDAAEAAATAQEAMDAAKEAAATASAAALNANEAAATASAAALNAKEAAARASAAALDAKEAAAVAASAGELAAAAMQASKKRKFSLIGDDQDDLPGSVEVGHGNLIDDQDDPPGGVEVDDGDFIDDQDDPPATSGVGDGGNVDIIHLVDDDDKDPPGSGDIGDDGSIDFSSRLPDAVLGSIVSLLPTKEGARTQAVSRRWRPLWRSAPLNLEGLRADLISKILSEHPGPGRHLSLVIFTGDCSYRVEGWLRSQALDSLQELELTYRLLPRSKQKFYLLPSSVCRFASTLRVAKFSWFHFPNSIVPLSLKFPCLQQLTLQCVLISEDALQGMLSGCSALESLELSMTLGFGRLCISSQTLKSLGFSSRWTSEGVRLQELVIEDAPCLERLLPLDPKHGPAAIRIISAPKLKILGVLSKDISELRFGTTVFEKMVAVSLTTKVHTVRVLVLQSDGPNLDVVLNFLKCFPCLESLYVIFWPGMVVNNVWKYDSLDPIECLELHLKKVVLKNYDNRSSSTCFAKFFVLNAKVLKEMKITYSYHRGTEKWYADQHRLLRIKDRASRDALIELKCGGQKDFTNNTQTHDLSMADPFDMPFRRCRVLHSYSGVKLGEFGIRFIYRKL